MLVTLSVGSAEENWTAVSGRQVKWVLLSFQPHFIMDSTGACKSQLRVNTCVIIILVKNVKYRMIGIH